MMSLNGFLTLLATLPIIKFAKQERLMHETDFSYNHMTQMLGGAIKLILEKSDDLSKLDAVIGDGDHGVTMARAMNKVHEVLLNHPSQDISNLLSDIAWALFDIDGGCAGPLYGSIFMGMSDGCRGKVCMTNRDFAEMMESGLESIQQQTKAQVGDKTMMDALIPAVQAIRMAAEQDKTIPEMLQLAAGEAMKGAEATRNIPARFGRAKFQGERTIGHPDPGSISMAFTFQGFLNGLTEG
jgi:phosphoenolpyruvate---glycerone phosphotransferase subunit DhaL